MDVDFSDLKLFSDFVMDLSDEIGFRVSSRGWAYILEQKRYINKDQFDRVTKVINRCRKRGYLPIDFCCVDNFEPIEPKKENMTIKYYTMKECFDECGDDDIPFIDRNGHMNNVKSKSQIENYKHSVCFSVEDYESDKWQIKRAEPKVLNPEMQWLKFLEKNKVDINEIEYGKLCHQNGRIERDLELRPLVEAVKNILSPETHDTTLRFIEEAFQQIPPLNEEK